MRVCLSNNSLGLDKWLLYSHGVPRLYLGPRFPAAPREWQCGRLDDMYLFLFLPFCKDTKEKMRYSQEILLQIPSPPLTSAWLEGRTFVLRWTNLFRCSPFLSGLITANLDSSSEWSRVQTEFLFYFFWIKSFLDSFHCRGNDRIIIFEAENMTFHSFKMCIYVAHSWALRVTSRRPYYTHI